MTGLKNIIRSMKGNRSLYSSLLLQTVIIVIFISTISAQLFQQRNNDTAENGDSKSNRNMVTTYAGCKKYLCKYGYLDCHCVENSNRWKRQLPGGIILTEGNQNPQTSNETATDNSNSSLRNTSTPTCSEEIITKALAKFQKNYRLEVTGECDERTKLQMSQRRCGQPDNLINTLTDDDPTADDSSKRSSRSLSEIISSNVELENSVERRKEQLQQYMKEIEDENVLTPAPGSPDSQPIKRVKRSQSQVFLTYDYGAKINKGRISWRLMSDHLYTVISVASQRSILRQAFRYWSEISPLCFYEQPDQQARVDIEIGFLEGVHLSCYRQFDGYGGEIAHKYHRDVHFDNSEPYTVDVSSDTHISLLLVAVHELGHVIGLNHSVNDAKSVMNALYHQSLNGRFELADNDRREVKSFYGPCHGRFDAAFDFVRTKAGTKNSRIYNSYFFRNDHYWKYQNKAKRSRTGDPVQISNHWVGLPENLDTYLHYWEFSTATNTFTDEYLFFKGSLYYSYSNHHVTGHGQIREKFPSYNMTTSGSIPVNLDAAFFDYRQQVELIYFFKGNMVYSYKYKFSGEHRCCHSITTIIDAFPPATAGDLYAPSGNTYTTDIDVVYLSNNQRALYFIKGNDTWVNDYFFERPQGNLMRYVGHWYDIWHFICDGECS